jgi:hypothetical protein
MAQFVSCFELYSNQNNATLGLDPNRVVKTLVNLVPMSGSLSGPLPFPIIRPSAYGRSPQIQASVTDQLNIVSHFFGLVTGSGGIAAVEAADSNFWAIEGAGFLTSSLIASAIGRATFPQGFGRTAPPPWLQWSGAAGVALNSAVSATQSVNGHAIWSYPEKNPYTNYSHFIEWHDEPPDSGNSGVGNPTRLHQLLNAISDGGASFTLGQLTGGPVVVNDCGFAGIAPEGAIYIRPEDWASGAADGIPDDMRQNQAANFRFHPSVFLRRTAYYRGISSPYSDRSAFNEASNQQPFDIIQIDTDPGVSNWLLIFDGAPQLVQLQHPQGSDLRRPRDIWNEVWVALLGGSQAIANAIEFGQVVQPSGFQPIPMQVITSRLRFLEYARCLPIDGVRRVQQGAPA